MPAHFMQR